jgi:hypothetical protein
MKRIIDGLTYDTDTATKVCDWHPDDDGDGGCFDNESYMELYQTRHGAFFQVLCGPHGPGVYPYEYVLPIDDEKAKGVVEIHANGLFEELFGPCPEAGSSERRLTFRIPASLQRRIKAAADGEQVNVNQWLMRAVESVLTNVGRAHEPI